jgi:gamma-glutamyl phosphate reductase
MILRSHRPQPSSVPTLRWYRYLAMAVGSVLAVALVAEAKAQSTDEVMALETLAATVGISAEETAAMVQRLASAPVDESAGNQALAPTEASQVEIQAPDLTPNLAAISQVSVPDIGLQISDFE